MKALLEYEALKMRQNHRNMKNKTIRINRKATVQDYARAHASTINHAIGADIGEGAATGAALGTVIPGIGNVIGGIAGATGGLIKGVTTSGDGRLNKKDFYLYRDGLYSEINRLYGTYSAQERIARKQIPIDVFYPFEHSTIKDSPVKNYAKEKSALDKMVNKYFPLVFGNAVQPTATIAPLNKTMEKAILEAGKIPPGGVSANLETFAQEVVAPATGQNLSGQGKQALENAAIEFIATLVEKKRDGETLPPIYDKIASGAMKVEEKVEQNVKASIAGDIGSVIMNNPIPAIGFFIFVIYLMTRGR